MATLTEVSFYTRRLVVVMLIVFVLILISPLVFRGIRRVFLAVFPPLPSTATKVYGVLPELVFPKPKDAYLPEYKLEIASGKLPDLSKYAKVFVVEINRARLLELDRMKARAKTLDFVDEPRGVDERTFIFNDKNLPRELVVDTIYGSYGYRYKWAEDGEFLKTRNVPEKTEAQNNSKSFFQGLGLLTNELVGGVVKYTYLAAKQDGTMQATGSLSEANFVRVDLFRADIESLKVVSTDWDTAAVNVIFSGQSDRLKRIVGANYNYSRIAPEGYGTYVLKSAQQAWSELTSGRGYIPKRGGQKVAIRKVTLAYFESNQPQQFVQPVFVFESLDGFVGYVSAVDPKYPDRPSSG